MSFADSQTAQHTLNAVSLHLLSFQGLRVTDVNFDIVRFYSLRLLCKA